MKKLLTSVALLLSFSLSALALNTIDSMDITVDLQEDGSAKITQVWSGDFDEGTECYIVQDHMNGMTIQDFKVQDTDIGPFTALANWDIHASRNAKAGKSGVVITNNGYELCWGIGDYGQRTYTVSYTMTDMVRAYTDYDGFNIRFINDKMSMPPKKATLTIQRADTALSQANSGIWGFGYDGQILFQDGKIYAYTESPMGEQNHMTVMVRLDKGIVAPQMSTGVPFEETKNAATENSDYTNNSDDTNNNAHANNNPQAEGKRYLPLSPFLLIGGLLLSLFASLGVAIIGVIKKKKAYRAAPLFRDIPQEGNINASHWLAHTYGQSKDKNSIIGALLLRFIYDGNLKLLTAEQSTFFGLSSKEVVSMQLEKPPANHGGIEAELYECLRSAAREDGILQEKELEKWCEQNYQQFMSLTNTALGKGESWLSAQGCFEKNNKWYSFGRPLSAAGKEELSHLYGFKKYLLDFSLISERDAAQVDIWQDCLVYASLLGIADRVAQQLKEIYPQFFQVTDSSRAIYVSYYMNRAAFSGVNRAYSAAQMARRSGSGGHASFGGGGGFSGGGSGGGSR